jgi:hypothetical protein
MIPVTTMHLIKTLRGYMARAAAALLPEKVLANKRYFHLWENHGYHITPVHFYEPIPDTRTLKDELWEKESALIGIDMKEEKQLALLSEFRDRFKPEYDRFPLEPAGTPYQFYLHNKVFGPVDAEVLYAMIRLFKPHRILEIGSGHSTLLAAQAVRKNADAENHFCNLHAYEPYPNKLLQAGFPGLSKLFTMQAQDIPCEVFAELKENDILFIDSSHVLKIGSDVQYEYLEVLPRLNKGVIVHIHDIFMPDEYPEKWVRTYRRFWNEQYLVQAFLSFNEHFEIVWAGRYMYLRHPDEIGKAFNSYRECIDGGPTSLWIRKTR